MGIKTDLRRRIFIENGVKHGIYSHKVYINITNVVYLGFILLYFQYS